MHHMCALEEGCALEERCALEEGCVKEEHVNILMKSQQTNKTLMRSCERAGVRACGRAGVRARR